MKLERWGEVFMRWMRTSVELKRVERGLHEVDEDLREAGKSGERSS